MLTSVSFPVVPLRRRWQPRPPARVLQRIPGGTQRRYVEHVRHTRAMIDEEADAKAKRHSMASTPAGTFTARNNASLATPSQCLNLDFDDLPALDHARSLL